jgi:hypothetical protein
MRAQPLRHENLDSPPDPGKVWRPAGDLMVVVVSEREASHLLPPPLLMARPHDWTSDMRPGLAQPPEDTHTHIQLPG